MDIAFLHCLYVFSALFFFPPAEYFEKIAEVLTIYFALDLVFVMVRQLMIRGLDRPAGNHRLLDILWNDTWFQSNSFLNIASILHLSVKSLIHACYYLACQAFVVLFASDQLSGIALAALVLSIPLLFVLELIFRHLIEKAVHHYLLDDERIQFYRSHKS